MELKRKEPYEKYDKPFACLSGNIIGKPWIITPSIAQRAINQFDDLRVTK